MAFQEYRTPHKLITSQKVHTKSPVIQAVLAEALYPPGPADTDIKDAEGQTIVVYLPMDFEGALPIGSTVIAVKDQDDNYIVVYPQINVIEGILDQDIPAYTSPNGLAPSGSMTVYLTTPQVQTLTIPYGATGEFGSMPQLGNNPPLESGFRITFKNYTFPIDSTPQAVYKLATTAEEIQDDFDASALAAEAAKVEIIADAEALAPDVTDAFSANQNDNADLQSAITSNTTTINLGHQPAKDALSAATYCRLDLETLLNYADQLTLSAPLSYMEPADIDSAKFELSKLSALRNSMKSNLETAKVRATTSVTKAALAVSSATTQAQIDAGQGASVVATEAHDAVQSVEESMSLLGNYLNLIGTAISELQKQIDATIPVEVSGGPLPTPLVFTFTQSNLFLLGFVLVGDLESIPGPGTNNEGGRRVLPLVFTRAWEETDYKITVQNLDPTRWMTKDDYCVCLKGQNGWVVAWAPYHG